MNAHNDERPRGRQPNHQPQPVQPQPRCEPREASMRPNRNHNRDNDEENFGKLTFTMPKFKGEKDVDAFIDCELKLENIFHIHN
jgi:hypothetical protein